MDFSRNYLVHYYEADSSRRLSLPALLQYFEDIALLHSSARGYNLEYYEEHHCGWMLLKWDIAIHRLPVFGETVCVGTHVHALKRFLADREFVLLDAEEKTLVSVRSNWLFVDTDRRRPLRVPEQHYKSYLVSPESETEFITIPEVPAVVLPENTDESSESTGLSIFHRNIRSANSDIDTNKHVNNVRYICWALDSLPSGYIAARTPVGMRVHYKKEIGPETDAEVLSLCAEPDANGVELSRHTVRNGTEEYCSLEIDWQKMHG